MEEKYHWKEGIVVSKEMRGNAKGYGAIRWHRESRKLAKGKSENSRTGENFWDRIL